MYDERRAEKRSGLGAGFVRGVANIVTPPVDPLRANERMYEVYNCAVNGCPIHLEELVAKANSGNERAGQLAIRIYEQRISDLRALTESEAK